MSNINQLIFEGFWEDHRGKIMLAAGLTAGALGTYKLQSTPGGQDFLRKASERISKKMSDRAEKFEKDRNYGTAHKYERRAQNFQKKAAVHAAERDRLQDIMDRSQGK